MYIRMIKFNTQAVALLLAMSVSLTTYAGKQGSDLSEYESVLPALTQCIACHGDNGVTLQPTFPILAGQHFYYLYVQLKDFKSGLRKDNIMGPIAADLSKPQMKLLAKYFS